MTHFLDDAGSKDPSALNSVEKSEQVVGLIPRVKGVGSGGNKVLNKGRKASKLGHILRTHWSGAPEKQRGQERGL